jgi:Zn-dependent protease
LIGFPVHQQSQGVECKYSKSILVMGKVLRTRIHYTWIFIIALVTEIVATQFSENYSLFLRVLLGLGVALLFLATLYLRELILNKVATHREGSFKGLTLFAFGGIFLSSRDKIVSAQPLSFVVRFLINLVLAAIFYGLYATFVNTGHQTWAGITMWLVYIYFLLFLINFIPALPLEGGEILRIILWKSTDDYYKATRIATLVTLIIAYALIFSGVLVLVLNQQWSLGLLIILSGWILQIAANGIRRQLNIYSILHSIKAEDVMVRDSPQMPSQTNLRQLVREQILVHGWRYVVVSDEGQFKGIVSLKQIQSIPPDRLKDTTLGELVTPYCRLISTYSQFTTDSIYDDMQRCGVDYLPVTEDEKFVGVVSREALLNVVKIRSDFGI